MDASDGALEYTGLMLNIEGNSYVMSIYAGNGPVFTNG